MKWSVHQLRKLSMKGFSFDETIVLDEIKEQKTDLRALSPIRVQGRMDFRETEITFHLDISGEMTLPCSRTLRDVRYPFSVHTTEIFLLGDKEEEPDDHVHVLTTDLVELRPLILELVLLEIPMQVFAEDLSDSDLLKGRDWELLDEIGLQERREQEKPSVDPRMAELSKFFQKQNDTN